jgi:hypothetical protein
MSKQQREPSEVAVHVFVQRLAGWVPDARLAAVRQTLAGGRAADAADAADAAVAMAAEHDVPMAAGSIEAARSLTGTLDALDGVQPATEYPALPFWFSQFVPDRAPDATDQDRAMAEVAQARGAQIAAVWRTWRLPLDGDEAAARRAATDPENPGRAHLVYVAQILDGAIAPALTGELQAALDGRGNAGVEVLAMDTVPPPYQAAALEGAALLWVPMDEGPPFRIARVFDFARPDTGPGFDPGHRVVTDSAELDRLLAYLTSGTLVLNTTARAQDVRDPEAGQVVPGSFRTDGEWIWTDTVAYYLEEHGLAPDEELAAYIDARWEAGISYAETNQETAIAAASFLLYPPPEYARQAAWTPGASG